MPKTMAPLVSCFFLWCGLVSLLLAKPHIVMVTGEKPPALEQLAATELEAMFERLFHVEASVQHAPADDHDAVLLVGTPASNPLLPEAAGKDALIAKAHTASTPCSAPTAARRGFARRRMTCWRLEWDVKKNVTAYRLQQTHRAGE